jgi:hypothetical protein
MDYSSETGEDQHIQATSSETCAADKEKDGALTDSNAVAALGLFKDYLEYLTTYYKSKIKPCVRNCLPFVNKL